MVGSDGSPYVLASSEPMIEFPKPFQQNARKKSLFRSSAGKEDSRVRSQLLLNEESSLAKLKEQKQSDATPRILLKRHAQCKSMSLLDKIKEGRTPSAAKIAPSSKN